MKEIDDVNVIEDEIDTGKNQTGQSGQAKTDDKKVSQNDAGSGTDFFDKAGCPEFKYKYTREKLDSYYIFDDEVLEGMPKKEKKFLDKVIKTYNAQKTPLDAFQFVIDYDVYIMSLQNAKQELNDEEKKGLDVPTWNVAKETAPVNVLLSEMLKDAVKRVVGNDGVKGVQRLMNYMGMLRLRNYKLGGEENKKQTEMLKNMFPEDDPHREKKASYISANHGGDSYLKVDNVLTMDIMGMTIKELDKMFPWGLYYFDSLKVDKNMTVEEVFKRADLDGSYNVFIEQNNCSKDDKLSEVFAKGVANNETPQSIYAHLAEDVSDKKMVPWKADGFNIYKSCLNEEAVKGAEEGKKIFSFDRNAMKNDPDLKEWIEKPSSKDPEKTEVEEIIFETDKQRNISNIKRLAGILTNGKSLDIALEPEMAKADAKLTLKLNDFQVMNNGPAFYYYDKEIGVSENFKASNPEVEGALSKEYKKARKNYIRTANMQEDSMDKLYHGLMMLNAGSYSDHKKYYNKEIYAQFGFAPDSAADDELEQAIRQRAYADVVGNDGVEGIRRLYNYLGILRSKLMSDYAKEWEANYKRIDEPNEELRNKKASYLTQISLSFTNTMLQSISNIILSVENWEKADGFNWVDDYMKTVAFDNSSTVEDYLLKRYPDSPDSRAGWLEANEANPGDNLFETYKRLNGMLKTDEDVKNNLRLEFRDGVVMWWLGEGDSIYQKYASTSEKKYLEKGRQMVGFGDSDFVSDSDPDISSWLKNGGQEFCNDIINRNVQDAADMLKNVGRGKKNIGFKNQDFVSDALIYTFKDTDYVKATLAALEKTGTGKSKLGWHTSNSTKYDNLLGSLRRFADALEEGRGGEAMDYRQALIKDCKDYIDGKYKLRDTDFGRERFDIVMTILMKNMSATEFGHLLYDINKKRSARTAADEGYINRDYYKEKLEDMVGYDRGLAASDYVNYADEDLIDKVKLLKGAVEALKKSDSKTMEPKSVEYMRLVKALNKLENACYDGVEDLDDLVNQFTETGREYIKKNCKLPMQDYQKERFDTVMTLLDEYLPQEDFGKFIGEINTKRKVRKEGQKGFLTVDDFEGREGVYTGLVDQQYAEDVEKEKAYGNTFVTGSGYSEYYNRIFDLLKRKPASDGDIVREHKGILKDINATINAVGGKGQIPEADFVIAAYAGALMPYQKKEAVNVVHDVIGENVIEEPADELLADEPALQLIKTEDEYSAGDINGIEAGRQAAAEALGKYAKGDKIPLAQMLVNSIRIMKERSEAAADFDDKLVVEADIAGRTIKLIEKDKELLKIAKREGLGEELVNFAHNSRKIAKVMDAAARAETDYLKIAADPADRKEQLIHIITGKFIGNHSKYLFDNINKKDAEAELRKGIKSIIKANKLDTQNPQAVMQLIRNDEQFRNLIQNADKTFSKNPTMKNVVKKDGPKKVLKQ